MKALITILFVWLFSWNPIYTFLNTNNINEANEDASDFYAEKKFEDAIKKYEYLLNELKDTSSYTKYHLAISNYHKGDTATARSVFQEALHNKLDPITVADIHFRLGNISLSQNIQKSVESYKRALRSYGDHLHAKLNLELALRLKQEKQQQGDNNKEDNKDKKKNKDNKDNKEQKQKNNKSDKNEDNKESEQKKKDEQKQKEEQKQNEKKSEEQKKREEREALKQKLKKIKMTPEKAKQILESMKNKEMQYIQSRRKQSKKRDDKNKPDW